MAGSGEGWAGKGRRTPGQQGAGDTGARGRGPASEIRQPLGRGRRDLGRAALSLWVRLEERGVAGRQFWRVSGALRDSTKSSYK